jgi:tetratricopeptide (TPR) repeat protein
MKRGFIAFSMLLAALVVGSPMSPQGPRPERLGDSLGREIAALESEAENFLSLARLAALHVKLGRHTGDPAEYAQAERMARKSLELFPRHNPSALLTLAQVEGARHRFDESIVLARSAAREGAPETTVASVLFTAYLAKSELKEARIHAEKLVKIRPSLLSYTYRALVLEAQGDTGSAIRDFRNAFRVEDIGESSESSWSHALYARLLMRQGRDEESAKELATSLELRPDSALALDLQGELALQQGDAAKAERLFYRAFSHSRQVAYLIHLAEAKARRGATQEARSLLTQAEQSIRASGDFGHAKELTRVNEVQMSLNKEK